MHLDTVYVDKLDGKISEDHYYRISNQWKDELRRCEEDLTRFQEANHTYMDDGVALLRLAREAHNIFASHEGATRRKLLTFVLSNCTWKGSVLTAEFRQPFNLLEESLGQLFDENNPNGYNDAKKDNWLTIASTLRTLFTAPDRNLKVMLIQIRRDEYGWFKPT